MGEHAPLILIELVLVLGGAMAFGWWQLRDVKREQAKRAAAKAAEAATAASPPPPPSMQVSPASDAEGSPRDRPG